MRGRKFFSLLVVLSLLLFAGSVFAQSPEPAQYVTISVSATGFTGTSAGPLAGSMVGASVNVTPHFSLAYNQVNVPATASTKLITSRLGVVNYTRTLADLVGSKLAAKFVFDPKQINITFQAGAGKSDQSGANRIAETGGAYLSYPLAKNVSLQVIGFSVIRSGSTTGILTTKAVTTGLNFNF